jgi:hypothetical protein
MSSHLTFTSLKSYIFLMFTNKKSYAFRISPKRVSCHVRFILPDFITPVILEELYKMWRCWLCNIIRSTFHNEKRIWDSHGALQITRFIMISRTNHLMLRLGFVWWSNVCVCNVCVNNEGGVQDRRFVFLKSLRK